MVLRTMMNSHKVKMQDNIAKVRTGVKAAVVIFPILGLTWVFGLMTFNRETLFFRYLFAVFNSAQGMLIFLFHCVLNKQVGVNNEDAIVQFTEVEIILLSILKSIFQDKLANFSLSIIYFGSKFLVDL